MKSLLIITMGFTSILCGPAILVGGATIFGIVGLWKNIQKYLQYLCAPTRRLNCYCMASFKSKNVRETFA